MHYTAVIKISQSSTPSSGSHPGSTRLVQSPKERQVTEIANIVIRADSIALLIAKATAHLDLVEDFKDGNN